MARDSGRNLMRERIAHLAARLMAQDGIEDYALAKRKAADQAGGPDARQLPDNDEIEAALKQYRALYQQEHPAQLRALRQLALEVMEELREFNPHLTGSVLKGSAGKYAVIHLQLFTDDGKGVEHYLINRGVNFRRDELRLYAGDKTLDAPVAVFERDGVEIRLALLPASHQRMQLKTGPQGRPVERAGRDALKTLIAAG